MPSCDIDSKLLMSFDPHSLWYVRFPYSLLVRPRPRKFQGYLIRLLPCPPFFSMGAPELGCPMGMVIWTLFASSLLAVVSPLTPAEVRRKETIASAGRSDDFPTLQRLIAWRMECVSHTGSLSVRNLFCKVRGAFALLFNGPISINPHLINCSSILSDNVTSLLT